MEGLWRDLEGGLWADADIPNYSTDPTAAAQVWEQLESRLLLNHVLFTYEEGGGLWCHIVSPPTGVRGGGDTWMEALCFAAKQLMEERRLHGNET